MQAAAYRAAFSGIYVSPVVNVIYFESEGIICSSVTGSGHDGFEDGGSYDL